MQVPKCLSQQWAKATGRGEVGKLRICKYVKHLSINKTAEANLLRLSYICLFLRHMVSQCTV